MRVFHSGNAPRNVERPHIVVEGYLDRSRFDVPLTRDPETSALTGWLFAAIVTGALLGAAWWFCA